MADRVAWQQPRYDQSGETDQRWIAKVVVLLEQEHGSADLGNRADPIEELVWIPLTRQTHRQNSMRSWQRIVDFGGPAALLEISDEDLAALLKDAGFSRQNNQRRFRKLFQPLAGEVHV